MRCHRNNMKGQSCKIEICRDFFLAEYLEAFKEDIDIFLIDQRIEG